MDIFKRISKVDDAVVELVKDQIENKIDSGNLDIVTDILSFVYGILKKRYQVSPIVIIIKLIQLLIDIAGDDLEPTDGAKLTQEVTDYLGDKMITKADQEFVGNE